MPLFNNYVLDEILIPVLFLFFLVSGIFGMGFGVGLAVYRNRVFQMFSPLNRWISARKNMAPMEVPRNAEPFFYKHRRWLGALFIVGGIFTIFMLAAKIDAAAVASLFGARRGTFIGPWIVQSLTTLLIMGSLLAIVVGVILEFFPYAIGILETRADHWVSSRQMIKGADTMHLPLDRLFQSSPRATGLVLAVGALVLTVISAIILAHH
jgi:hypothetical protein